MSLVYTFQCRHDLLYTLLLCMKMYAFGAVYIVYERVFSINETHNARIMASIYCKVESYTTFRLLHHRHHHHQYTNAPNNNGSTRFVFIFVFNSREKEPSNCACLDAFFSFPQPVSIFPMCLSHHSLNSLIAGSCIYFCSLRQFCAILFP